MSTRSIHPGALAIALSLVAACGASRGQLDDGGSNGYDIGRIDAPNPIQPPPDADAGLPPEIEERRSFSHPQAGARYVFVANPIRNNVASIDSTTLAVRTVEAGASPRFLATVRGQDTVVVINEDSDNATIVRATERGMETSFVPVARDANAVVIAPDGRHAVLYFDTNAFGAGRGGGSYQDLTVITLEPGRDTAVDLSVGFRPIDVVFSADGSTAFVVTEDGISTLRFADIHGPAFVPSVSLGDSEYTRDTQITSDGRFAVARREERSTILLADLAARTLRSLDLGAPVTDIDLAPSGAYALAVIRERGLVLRIPLPGGFEDPSRIERIDIQGETVGSVSISPDGRRAVLFTTAAEIERMTVIDLEGSVPPYSVRLRKPVRSVAMSPDGATALIIHRRSPGDRTQPGLGLDERIDRSFGYSLLDLASGFVKLQLTSAEIGPLAITPDGNYAFVTLRDDATRVREIHRDSMRSFVVDAIQLGSPPISVGNVPNSQRAFIAQEHPEGRITFVDWNTGAIQSVTGFELNSRIAM